VGQGIIECHGERRVGWRELFNGIFTLIANDRQYSITKSWLRLFEEAPASVEERHDLRPRARQALRDQYDSQAEELGAQIAEYESFRLCGVTALEVDSLNRLPGSIISDAGRC
jgi:hypothetical protein